jgi:hypothetical protein
MGGEYLGGGLPVGRSQKGDHKPYYLASMSVSLIKRKTISKPTNLGIFNCNNCNQVCFKALLRLMLIMFLFFNYKYHWSSFTIWKK